MVLLLMLLLPFVTQIWAALLGVNYVGVLHTTRFIYDEAAPSLGPAALEALQTSGFSQYHEVPLIAKDAYAK